MPNPDVGKPPLGFVAVRDGDALGWYREDLRDELCDSGLAPGGTDELPASEIGGRNALRQISLDGRSVLVRQFVHGGLLGRVTGRRFRDPRRPFVELQLAERLAAVHVPVVEVVAARARRVGAGWWLDLATLRVDGAVDLGAWLGRRRQGQVSDVAHQRLVRAAAKVVARLHGVGFRHADLQPANLLAVGDPEVGAPEVLVLDLDRSRFLADLDADARHRNLARLWRHVRRRDELYGPTLTRADRARFLVAWSKSARGTTAPDAWRRAWRAIEALERRGRGAHRLGWWLGGVLGARGRDARAQDGSTKPLRRSRG